MEGENKIDSIADGGVVTREELFALVWAEPMLKVAKQFGVSSSYMARVCTAMYVPRPERGYWAKLAFGQTVPKPKLPSARPGDMVSWGRGSDLSVTPKTIPVAPSVESIPPRKVARKHVEEHPLLRGAKALFEAGRTSYWSEYLKPSKKLLVDLTVTKTGIDRAISFANTLFWHFEDCGHRVVIAPEHEQFRRAFVDEHEIPKRRNDNDGYSRNLWSPGRPTIVYIGSVAFGISIIELSDLADAKSINGGYERLEASVAKRLKERDRDSWRYTTHDFPSNRLCLQAFSPYRIAPEWTKQWREAKGEDLKRRIPIIVEELVRETSAIVDSIKEGERQAEIQRQEWEQQRKKWEREEAERKAAEALKRSKQQLLDFMDAWGKSKRINAFLDEVAAAIPRLDDELRPQFEHRLELIRGMIGDTDAFRGLQDWKSPEEWLAEEAAIRRPY